MSNNIHEIALTHNILQDMGIVLSPDAKILDFGCGAGAAVYAYLDRGYGNVYGYDIQNYLALRNPQDAYHFFFSQKDIATHQESFDFIFSNQVFEHVMDYPQTLRQIYGLLKPGGISLHFFPSKWRFIEPHIYVPFAGVFSWKLYLGFWAKMGIRNEFQQGKNWRDAQESNVNFCKNHLNYLSSANIYQVCRSVFERVEFREDLFIKHSPGRLQKFPKILKSIPGLTSFMRECHARTLFLQKLPK